MSLIFILIDIHIFVVVVVGLFVCQTINENFVGTSSRQTVGERKGVKEKGTLFCGFPNLPHSKGQWWWAAQHAGGYRHLRFLVSHTA